MDWVGYGWMGWDLCVGLLYEHRFAMLIISKRIGNYIEFMFFVVLHAFCGTKISSERGAPKNVIL